MVENHRQGDGNKWARILNELRVGNITEEAVSLLKTRLTTDPFLDQDSLHVFYTNKEVADHNSKMLANINEPLVHLPPIKRGPRGYSFSTQKHGTIDGTQFLDSLELKVGARICIVFNVNTIDGLVNGALGTVLAFEKNKHQKIEAIIVKFDEESAGEQQRQNYPVLAQKYSHERGTPIFRQELEYHITSKRGKTHAPRAKIVQFPMRLAWANTAHKMQGQTIKAGSKLVVHWNKRFLPGMAYVMLGRCERIEDLFIAGDFDSTLIQCSPAALKEAKRITQLVTERQLATIKQQSKSLKISCLNIRSFSKHIKDIKCLRSLMDSDLIGLCETWTHPGFHYDLDGFNSSFINVGRGKGLAVFTKVLNSSTHSHQNESFSAMLVNTSGLNCIFLYISKGFNPTQLFDLLDNWIDCTPTLILGDVNWHWSDQNPMKTYLLNKNFTQLVKRSTHEEGHILDHAYVSANLLTAQITQYAVLFSDHDVITVTLPME